MVRVHKNKACPRQSAELDDVGGDGCHAGDWGLSLGHPVAQVDRPVGHPRRRVEGREEAGGGVLGQTQQGAVARPTGLQGGAGPGKYTQTLKVNPCDKITMQRIF